ncbi:hypothetical protein PG995_007647 [Apiospora arundinis]
MISVAGGQVEVATLLEGRSRQSRDEQDDECALRVQVSVRPMAEVQLWKQTRSSFGNWPSPGDGPSPDWSIYFEETREISHEKRMDADVGPVVEPVYVWEMCCMLFGVSKFVLQL